MDYVRLAIMTKAPRAGEVKTRLTPPLTAEEAAALNICFLRDIASMILGAGGRCARYRMLHAGRCRRLRTRRSFRLIFSFFPNGEIILTERLIFALEDLFAIGFSSVCLIGFRQSGRARLGLWGSRQDAISFGRLRRSGSIG